MTDWWLAFEGTRAESIWVKCVSSVTGTNCKRFLVAHQIEKPLILKVSGFFADEKKLSSQFLNDSYFIVIDQFSEVFVDLSHLHI